jgi:hypothetical protein
VAALIDAAVQGRDVPAFRVVFDRLEGRVVKYLAWTTRRRRPRRGRDLPRLRAIEGLPAPAERALAPARPDL